MKTPHFWYEAKMGLGGSLLSLLLLPASIVFKAGGLLRRYISKPYLAKVPLICVGNVVAGGAGKTPTALALGQILKDQGQRPVFVTRGYGGQLTDRGDVVRVNAKKHTAHEIGDEALLLAAFAPTWASRDRVAAIREAEQHGSLIILDDGLQNPNIMPSTSVLVVDGDVGLGNGRIIPAGPLREDFGRVLERVQVLLILGETDRFELGKAAKAQAQIEVLRGRVTPDLPERFPQSQKFVVFAGIARPEKVFATAKSLGLDLVDMVDFPDHHPYTAKDMELLRALALEKGAKLLTTAKDAVRLPPAFRSEVLVLPVELTFFDARVADLFRRFVRDFA